LVTEYDGEGVPKVIDFGLAKAMHQPLTDDTICATHDVTMGTPLYMSPEQTEVNNLDIDTRTDVYSLGVILHELLTGTTPIAKSRFRGLALIEVLRLVKEADPQKPSAKLSSVDALPLVAGQRRLDPAQLRHALRGDLDRIVLKSLEKERSGRYDTVAGLARD